MDGVGIERGEEGGRIGGKKDLDMAYFLSAVKEAK
jgi:hypothetical protein